jgi:branched-subunit amino acid transport protein
VNDNALMVVMVGGALGTLLLRASFLVLVPGDALPAWARRGLRYVPPAVLAALAVSAFVPTSWPVDGPGALARPLAALVAGLVAWRSGHVLLTIGSGMAALWALNALL